MMNYITIYRIYILYILSYACGAHLYEILHIVLYST